MRFAVAAIALPVLVVLHEMDVPGLERAATAEALTRLVADCDQPYFPDLSAPPVPVLRYASRGTGPVALHRPMRIDPLRYTREPAPDIAPAAFVERYDGDDFIFVGVVVPSGTGACDRLLLYTSPGQVRIATRESRVVNQFSVALEGGAQSITIPGQQPDTLRIDVYVYENGQPKIEKPVKIWADYRGVPPEGAGRTVAHEHLYFSGTPSPTLRIEGALYTESRPLEVTTDEMGVVRTWAVPGYRGGVETVLAETKFGDRDVRVLSSVVLTVFPRLVHFAEAMGYAQIPDPNRVFPFVLTGTDYQRHMYPHFIRQDVASLAYSILRDIWTQDVETRRAAPGDPDSRFLQLSRMSLEYGGVYKLASNATCDNPDHAGALEHHHLGIDFDLIPCYTDPGGIPSDPRACQRGTAGAVRIDERILAAHILGRGRGVIAIHCEEGQGPVPNGVACDGVPFAYHIRLGGFR